MSTYSLLLTKRFIIVTLMTVLFTITTAQYFETDEDFFQWQMRSRGTAWPKPAIEKRQLHFYVYAGNIFSQHNNANSGCPVIKKAEERFIKHMATLYSYANPNANMTKTNMNKGNLQALKVHWSIPCNKYPFYDMNESYNLTIQHDITLEAVSIWGIIRGLETMMQLFYIRDEVLVIHENEIRDYPMYKHRGLMIDTARHYIPPSEILMMLDAMAMNKMNVLHWHIIDDESFPYVSRTFPGLSEKGSFYREHVYNMSTITEIVNYAAVRGIRVIPGFPIPDHSASIAKIFPDIFITCPQTFKKPASFGPLNPLITATYTFLGQLFADIATDFPDQFIHLGFNDIKEDCWLADEQVGAFLERMPENLRHDALHVIVLEEISKIWRNINREKKTAKSKFIIWQDATVNRTLPTEDVVVQMVKNWIKGGEDASLNFTVIYSVGWNLGNAKNKFEDMYLRGKNLRSIPTAIGGEAYLWGYEVDELNLANTVWPLASAVAEVLWNPEAIDDVEKLNCTETKTNGAKKKNGWPEEKECEVYIDFSYSVYGRLEEHICRMMRLGINASPGREMCDVLPTTPSVTETTTTAAEDDK